MNVLVVEPGYLPYEKEIPYDEDIGKRVSAMQEIVGGLICEIFPFDEDVALVSNDDSIGMGMPFNRSVPGGYGGIFGNFFLCGIEEDHYCSLTPDQVEKYKVRFRNSELLIGVKGNEPVTLPIPSKPKLTEKPPHEKQHSNPER